MDLNDLLSGLMADMRNVSDTASMIGKPVKVGTSQMVPLLGVTIGFGTATTDMSGSGERRGGRLEGGGAGGTMVVTPRAFVVVGGDGIPQLVTLKDGKYGQVQASLELAQLSAPEPREPQALPAAAPATNPSRPARGTGDV